MLKVPEQHRISIGIMVSTAADGNNGVFSWTMPGRKFTAIASDGLGWEHVSVSITHKHHGKVEYQMPSWDDMCLVKKLFWDKEDCVVQYHPAASEHVNTHEFVLHLWRPTIEIMPRPNPIMVGLPS